MYKHHQIWIEDKCSKYKKAQYNKSKYIAQKLLRQMKENWWRNKAAELQEAADKKDMKTFYQNLNKIYGPRLNGTAPVL